MFSSIDASYVVMLDYDYVFVYSVSVDAWLFLLDYMILSWSYWWWYGKYYKIRGDGDIIVCD